MRVLVADDQEVVRVGLVTILSAQPGIEVVGQAADGDAMIDPAVTARLLCAFAATRRPNVRASTQPLTEREGVVPFLAVARGPSNTEIAEELFIQPQHREVPPHQPHDQIRRPQPRRTRHRGPRIRAARLMEYSGWGEGCEFECTHRLWWGQ